MVPQLTYDTSSAALWDKTSTSHTQHSTPFLILHICRSDIRMLDIVTDS